MPILAELRSVGDFMTYRALPCTVVPCNANFLFILSNRFCYLVMQCNLVLWKSLTPGKSCRLRRPTNTCLELLAEFEILELFLDVDFTSAAATWSSCA